MNLKKLSRWETIGIVCCISIFVFLSLVVIFKSEWLDSFFYGASQQEEGTLRPILDEEARDLPAPIEKDPYASLVIISKTGSAFVYLNLEEEASLTGIELSLEKDESLDITDFVCLEPFECVLVDFNESEISIVAIIPPGSVDLLPQGELFVGEFSYSGTGNLYFRSSSESIVSTLEDPEFNILNFEELEFLLD